MSGSDEVHTGRASFAVPPPLSPEALAALGARARPLLRAAVRAGLVSVKKTGAIVADGIFKARTGVR